MADDQTSQQTRVLLVNGQTIILQGDAGDNSINEINADLLQQALQEVSTTAEDPVEEPNDEYNAPIPDSEDTNDNLVAIFQGDQGETHTIHLTVEQAEALGLHFSMDSDDKPIHSDLSDHATNNSLYITEEPNTQLVYSEDTKPSSSDVMFENELDTNTPCSDLVQSNRNIESNNERGLETSGEGLGVLSSTVNTLINEQNQPITLIPQYVSGQMTYAVKIQDDEDEDNLLENRQYTNMDSDLKSVHSSVSLHQTNARVNLNNITSFANSSLSSVSCSASTNSSLSSLQSVPLTASSIQQSSTLPPISSVQQSVSLPTSVSPVQQSVTLPISSVTQSVSVSNSALQETLSLNNFHCARTSGANISQDKQTKVSYVILPGSNTSTSSSVTTKFSSAPLGRLTTSFVPSNRHQSLINSNNVSTALKTATSLPLVNSSAETSHVLAANNSVYTGIPSVSSNNDVISSSMLSAAATSAGSGMIRVMAGNTSNRTLNNNTSKYTSVLAPSSGRLVGSTGNVTTIPKIVSINPSSVNKVPTTATPEVTNMVSAALTRMPVPNFNSTKPLGSSENPIQLVQHGQTFHSVQSLTQEQLRQIATVLQQQHLESAPRTKNVVYDAETNTRIIYSPKRKIAATRSEDVSGVQTNTLVKYRVVYPEDLDLRDPRSPDSKGGGQNAGISSSSSRGRGRRGRPPKSNLRGHGRGVDGGSGRRTGVSSGSVDMDFDEDRLILDDTAKGEKKKQLSRTRSGRLSRPPRHMVKDYKRLHHLDFADADLDDSDGGYSDYQMSEHEAEDPPEKTDSKELLPGLAVPKRKISSHFRCPTCQKIYLGYSRMSRHFEMYPDHGSIEQLQMATQANTTNNNVEDTTDRIDSNKTTKVAVAVAGSGLNGIVRTGSAKRRGKKRGPWAYATPEARSQRRKGKLREVLATCEANELAEVAGPAVAGVLSLWDLLLLRVEAVRTAEESYVATLCDELQALLEKVRAVATEIFKPLDMKTDRKERQFELQDELLCTTFGVASGTYVVDDSKLQHMTPSKELSDEPLEKRIRSELPEDEEVKNHSTKCESAVTNDDESCVNSGVIDKQETQCPEVLSALTLIAKPSESQKSNGDSSVLPARTSGDEDESMVVDGVAKSEDFLLSSESNDICPKLTSVNNETAGNSSATLEQTEHTSEFVNPEHHSQELETVDDIVNERLKNLTSGSNLVDFSVAAPINVQSCMKTSSIDISKSSMISSQDLIDRLGQFRSLPLPNDVTSNEVPSFDPEMALAAMGEGEQDSVSASSQHFQSTLQQMETVPSDSGSSFDPEVALVAMGEGEQPTSIESQRNQFQQLDNVPNGASFTPEDALAAMGEGEQNPVDSGAHGQFQNTLPQMNSIDDARQSFDPEIALAAMGEGDQVTNDGTSETENRYQSTLQQMRMNDMSGNTEPFDPEVALAAMGEGTTSGVNSVQNQFSSGANTSNNPVHSYNTAINLHSIGNDGSIANKSSAQCSDNVTRFDPEMALAAMGEGQPITVNESSHIPYQSPISQSNPSSEPNSTFDAEMALAAIGEEESVQTSTSSQRSHSSVNASSFQLQCAPDLGLADTSMDVSLDESGSELDFEALSEEFNRNTRHR